MPIETISTFRKKIKFQFLIVLCITIIVVAGTISIKVHDPLLIAAENTVNIFFLVLTFMLYERRKALYKVLKSSSIEFINEIGAYQEKKKQQSKFNMFRLIILSVLAILMVFLFIYFPQSSGTGLVASFWMAAVLLVILNYWIEMTDQFMLQDIKHGMNDHHSESSE